MKIDHGKIVLVTGAASGIGRSFALAAAKKGARLIITDVNKEGLEKTAESIRGAGGAVLLARDLDVADRGAVLALAADVLEKSGPVDVLANVAGVALFAQVEDMSHSDWERVVNINLWGVIHMIEAFAPAMIKAGRGHVVNVSSLAGLMGVPWHLVYSATKFAVNGLSEVLRLDLKKHGVGVTLVCPGAVDTGLVETVKVIAPESRVKRFKGSFRKIALSPDKVAGQMMTAVEKNRFLVLTSVDVHIAWFFKRHFPWLHYFAMRVVSRLMDNNLKS